jgi:acetylornithine deacetylase/succinyl-diaminopimelate desuccinylase-like protein
MTLDQILADDRVRRGLDFLESHEEDVIEEISRIAAIPSPSYQEHELAHYYAARLRQAGVGDVTIDSERNAYGVIRGSARRPALLMSAHLDTVFPLGTNLSVRREGSRLFAPGIGDDSTGLAAVLWAARAVNESGVKLQGDLYVAGNSCEEGLGDLKGMKALMKTLRDHVDMVVPVEPSSLGRIANQGVGSRRFRITARTHGGHSWGAFGAPSAIHTLCQVVADISAIEVPKEPKTTYNVGKFSGGVSVNTIAPEATMELDMRSVDVRELSSVEHKVHAILEARSKKSGVALETVLVGDRPPGATPESDPLIAKIREVHRALGIRSFLHAGSTDANVPMWMGIPAATIGVTTGGNGHRVDEYIDLGPLGTGLQQIFLLMVYLLS